MRARARLEYEDRALSSFRTYLLRNKAAADPLVTGTTGRYRGYVEPSYREYVPPARWGRTIDLRPTSRQGRRGCLRTTAVCSRLTWESARRSPELR